MPTQLQALRPTLDGYLADLADNFSLDTKRAMLAAAAQEIHRIMIATQSGQSYWLVKSQWGDSGAEDYFPVFEKTVTEYALPANFMQLRAVRCETVGKEYIRFQRTRLDSDAFAYDQGTPNTMFSDLASYDIVGVAPGSMVLSLSPPATLEVRLHYIRTAPIYTAWTDTIDEYPRATHDLMAEWAAMRLTFGLSDKRFRDFAAIWSGKVHSWIAGSRRDNTGPDVVEGFLEDAY